MGNITSVECSFSSSKKSLNRGETGIDMTILFENGCLGNAHMDISYTGRQKHAIACQKHTRSTPKAYKSTQKACKSMPKACQKHARSMLNHGKSMVRAAFAAVAG